MKNTEFMDFENASKFFLFRLTPWIRWWRLRIRHYKSQIYSKNCRKSRFNIILLKSLGHFIDLFVRYNTITCAGNWYLLHVRDCYTVDKVNELATFQLLVGVVGLFTPGLFIPGLFIPGPFTPGPFTPGLFTPDIYCRNTVLWSGVKSPP